MLLSAEHRRALMEAARDTIRRTLRDRTAPPADGSRSATESAAGRATADPALFRPAGCFVTLHRRHTHALRGCVGRLDAAEPLLHAVRHAAAGVSSDPRFVNDPVRLEELPHLEIDISVLSPLRPAPHPLAFDPRTDGIYLTCGQRTGCFLPQVAQETGWSKEQLLARLCTEKMGLPPTAWRDPQARLQVFTTLVIGPESFVPDADFGFPRFE